MANNPQKSTDATESTAARRRHRTREANSAGLRLHADGDAAPPRSNADLFRDPQADPGRGRAAAAPPMTTAPPSARSCRRCSAARRARPISSPALAAVALGRPAPPPSPGVPGRSSSRCLRSPRRRPGAGRRHRRRRHRADRGSSIALAHMIRRAQDLRLVAESMAEVAMRLPQPETTAREVDRQRRPGDPPRSRRHGRRRRARARPRRRTRSAGAQRSLRARARL